MQKKTALLFAGQGAQYVGMGKDLSQQFPEAREWFARAAEILGFDVGAICQNGPEAELTRTENCQPGIFLVSWIALQLLQKGAPQLAFEATAGLSLGELTALAAGGAMSFEDGLRVARRRGRFMQEACEQTHGGMAAVLGLDTETMRAVCAEAEVEMANLNCPGQIVISGEAEKIGRAVEVAKGKGAKRAVALTVAGAYHSRLMASAQPKVREMMRGTEVKAPGVMVISNVTAQPHGQPEEIRERLAEQVISPVRWEDSIRYLLGQGFTRFIELGPGTALSGFLKRIEPGAERLNVADAASLEATVKALEN